MKYNQPLDQPGNANAPYIDGNPAAGVQGSIVPAASVEYDQREIVEVIGRANSRGYKDFTDTLCGAPANADLLQLRKAIEGFIKAGLPSQTSDLIDTHITFKVHGAGADFADLIAAYYYLSKFKITATGRVTLQLAAGQFTYNTPVELSHPNGNRILVLGATMKAPVPGETGFAHNGNSSGQRAADTAANLTMLRNCFATEIRFNACGGLHITGYTPFALDAILISSVNTPAGTSWGICWINAVQGIDSAQPPYQSGLAVVGFQYGMVFANNGNIQIDCPQPLVICGASVDGINLVSKAGLFHNGPIHSYSNGRAGLAITHHSGALCPSASIMCNAFVGIEVIQGRWTHSGAHLYKNASYGIQASYGASVWANATDFGSGANVNGGTAYAAWGSTISVSNSANIGSTNPALNTTGNGNSFIG
jgi:hypothetical protein